MYQSLEFAMIGFQPIVQVLHLSVLNASFTFALCLHLIKSGTIRGILVGIDDVRTTF